MFVISELIALVGMSLASRSPWVKLFCYVSEELCFSSSSSIYLFS